MLEIAWQWTTVKSWKHLVIRNKQNAKAAAFKRGLQNNRWLMSVVGFLKQKTQRYALPEVNMSCSDRWFKGVMTIGTNSLPKHHWSRHGTNQNASPIAIVLVKVYGSTSSDGLCAVKRALTCFVEWGSVRKARTCKRRDQKTQKKNEYKAGWNESPTWLVHEHCLESGTFCHLARSQVSDPWVTSSNRHE